MLNRKKNNKGFTLVELLVVIAIIGILAVVAVPALFKNIEKGKIADLEADISAIRSAALSVYADKSEMPVEQKDILTATTEIGAELEGLSNPFKATSYKTVSADNGNKLLLEITVGKGISKDGVQKLINDLGDKYVNNTGVTVTTAEPISSNSSIYIKLMSK